MLSAHACPSGPRGKQIVNRPSKGYWRIFLEEVAAFEGDMGLILRTRNPFLHVSGTATGNWVAIAEGGEKGFLPALQSGPRFAVSFTRRVVRAYRHQARKRTGAGFV